MGGQAALADRAKRNGSGAPKGGEGRRLRPQDGIGRLASGAGGLRRRGAAGARLLVEPAVRRLRRNLTADLDDRDPDYVREHLPLMWLIASLWFRGEVRGLGHVPDRGPVLLVGNRSGGNIPADTLLFTLAFSTYFGVERRFHQLAHHPVLALPLARTLRPFGAIAASREHAARALAAGAAVLVYPGGDREAHRPFWERNRVDLAGRKGFVALALGRGVPIVPVVAIGGQETALFLGRGDRLARALRLDRLGIKAIPISIALPWIVNVGDLLGHLPLPSKLTIEVLAPIDLEEELGADPDLDEVYDRLVSVMQDALDRLASERRLPVIG